MKKTITPKEECWVKEKIINKITKRGWLGDWGVVMGGWFIGVFFVLSFFSCGRVSLFFFPPSVGFCCVLGGAGGVGTTPNQTQIIKTPIWVGGGNKKKKQCLPPPNKTRHNPKKGGGGVGF